MYTHWHYPTPLFFRSSISTASCLGTFFFSNLPLNKTSLEKPLCRALVNASHTVRCHSFAYGRTATGRKNYPASPIFIGKTTPFATSMPVPLNSQQHMPSLHNQTHSPWYSPAVTLINMLFIIGLCIPTKQSFTEH